MEEILEIYRKVMSGQPDNTTLSYDNLNINFSGGFVNLYDYTGEMPCGRYRIPPNEQIMMDKLQEWNEKIGDLTSLDQYLCGKCAGTFDKPEFKRDKYGAYICESCANGGDIRKPAVESKKVKDDAPIEKSVLPKPEAGPISTPSTVSKAKLNVDDAIKFLKENGYVIKKSVKSFKVVAQDAEGAIGVTEKYYRSKEEFEAKMPALKFISMVKELSTSNEEPLD